MKVSIIIPSYNTDSKLLNRCLESIVRQTFTDYEVVIVDDGSHIPVSEKIEQPYKDDDRIRVIRQENGGVSVARNTGLGYANGDYIMFVDADDCVNKEWLDYAVSLATENQADIVYGKITRCQRTPDMGTSKAEALHLVIHENELWRAQEALLYNDTSLLPGLPYLDLGPCGKLYKASCMKGVEFPDGIKLSEDQVFNHAVLRNCQTCVITNAEAYYYIENTQSVSHAYHPDAVEVISQAMNLVRKYLLDCPQVTRAYYFRVIDDMLNAIQFAYFSKNRTISIIKQIVGIRYAKSTKLLSEALEKFEMNSVSSKAWKLKVLLLKHSTVMFVLFKRAYGASMRRTSN